MNAGWYIHHHGTGHLQRYRVMRRRLPGLVGLSSLPRPDDVPATEWISLPPDAPASARSEADAGGALHWAPLGHDGLRTRMALIAQWVAAAAPDVFVVDVSVEVAGLVRLMGVPIVWVAQRGRRLDAPHQLAYRLSTVAAPWTEGLDSAGHGLPSDARHVGAISRFDDRRAVPPPGDRTVALLLGAGGHGIHPEQVAAAQRATPHWSWKIAGVDDTMQWQDPESVWTLLSSVDVVVGSAGHNVVAEVAAARRGFICLPQQRPFDEQLDQADALMRGGLAKALTAWPAACAWSDLLAQAADHDPGRWSALHDGQGAQRLAQLITEVACASA